MRRVPRIPATYAVIPLGNNRGVAVVDIQDFELVSQYPWHVHKKSHTNYARRTWYEDGRHGSQYMHQLITGYKETDHEDGDGLNNRRSNLRDATSAQNNANRSPRPGCSSKYKGVHWRRDGGKWCAKIKIAGRQQYLGRYAVEEDAARAYDAAAFELWGAYALLNRDHFPGQV
jgi:AP2 domain